MEQEERVEREDMAAEYANNTLLEPSVWDLKIFFGQWYQSKNGEVDWHTAVTIPWMQAKLLSHYLQVNLALYEDLQGPIKIPDNLLPKPGANSAIPPNGDPSQARSIEIIEEMTKRFLTEAQK